MNKIQFNSRLIIKNFGPIDNIDVRINKINIFIGNQGSGKSTIVKLLSFCEWVEKRYLIEEQFTYTIEDRLLKFHRIDSHCFKPGSYIKFESDAIEVSIDDKKHISIHPKDKTKYYKTKNIYIPAERNFATTISNLGRYNEASDNILNYIYDWNEARHEYVKQKNILNTGISFSHSEDNEDLIHFTVDKEEKHILLRLSSSGFQSVVPLVVLFDYLTDGFYKTNKPHSLYEKILFERTKKGQLSNELVLKFIISIENENVNQEDLEKAISVLSMENISKYHYSRFIIEEPELNLYPETQKDLVYYFFRVLSQSKHQLTITTHSPFILYAINNCLMGHLISKKMPLEEQEELASKDSWIDPGLVSIWQVEDGSLKDLKQEDTKVIGPHSFDGIMSGVIGEYFEMLGYFGDEESTEGIVQR